jgi:hypothetical protein
MYVIANEKLQHVELYLYCLSVHFSIGYLDEVTDSEAGQV